MVISLIAAVDEAWGIGKQNQLLCHLPADLRHFKQITMGKPIIMGRLTFESIGKPLPGRKNIVLTRRKKVIPGVFCFTSLAEALHSLEAEEIMIIGGGKLFEQSFGLAQRIYLTRIHNQFDADTFFPKINETEWTCIETEYVAADEKNNYDMTFQCYERVKGMVEEKY